jgi:hypothetical protein
MKEDALALTDKQLHLLRTAAAAVPVQKREAFLTDVAKHLRCPEVSDAAVSAAINSGPITVGAFLYR